MVAGRRFVRSASAAACRLVALIAFAACRDEPTSATAPFSVEASLSAVPERTVGTIVTPSPTFVVRNANGDALANVPVTITVTAGGGTLLDPPLRTESGATSVGRWTLDTIAGLNEITIVAGDAPRIRGGSQRNYHGRERNNQEHHDPYLNVNSTATSTMTSTGSPRRRAGLNRH